MLRHPTLALALSATLLPCQTVEDGVALQRTRAVWFGQDQNPIAAEVGMSFEPRPWDEATEKVWAAGRGARLPLAETAWAEFATFTNLRFGTVDVKSGSYYAVLERTKDGAMLGLFDAEKVRTRRLAPGIAKGEVPVAAIPLAAREGPQGPLRIEFAPEAGRGAVGLQLQWGTQTWTATASVAGAEGASPIALPDPRRACRVTWPPRSGQSPMAVVDHGALPWSDERKVRAEALDPGQRWRLGKDWATTLDTNTPLALGGKKLDAGLWHLTMEKTTAGWSLAISSAVEDYAGKLDGFAANHVHPVLVVPLREDAERLETADLMVRFQRRDQQLRLVISGGGEQFFVPVEFRK